MLKEGIKSNTNDKFYIHIGVRYNYLDYQDGDF